MPHESADDYTVRWFDASDREPFLDLYEEAFGGGSPAWFEWKYVENPRVSHVPILVATTADGAFAGARAQVPFRMRAGDGDVTAMRFGDTMVHPDHRRRGVFTRLTEYALDYYARTGVSFCYNVPNDQSRPGFLKAGGEIVANLTSYYRVQDPGALASSFDAGVPGALAGLARPAARAYLDARDRSAVAPSDVSVTAHETPPVDVLAELYARGAPSTVHAVRDRAFLAWRYRNPKWSYRTYVAREGGEALAAVVTGTATVDGVTTTNLVDVLPAAPADGRRAGLRALLPAVLDDARDSALVAYCGTAMPPEILGAHGFHADDALPLSAVTTPTRLVAYGLGDDGWTANDLDLRDPVSWGLSYAELDAR